MVIKNLTNFLQKSYKIFQISYKILQISYIFYFILGERVDIFLEKPFQKIKNNRIIFVGGPFLEGPFC